VDKSVDYELRQAALAALTFDAIAFSFAVVALALG
jgi:hypothetical protein